MAPIVNILKSHASRAGRMVRVLVPPALVARRDLYCPRPARCRALLCPALRAYDRGCRRGDGRIAGTGSRRMRNRCRRVHGVPGPSMSGAGPAAASSRSMSCATRTCTPIPASATWGRDAEEPWASTPDRRARRPRRRASRQFRRAVAAGGDLAASSRNPRLAECGSSRKAGPASGRPICPRTWPTASGATTPRSCERHGYL